MIFVDFNKDIRINLKEATLVGLSSLGEYSGTTRSCTCFIDAIAAIDVVVASRNRRNSFLKFRLEDVNFKNVNSK